MSCAISSALSTNSKSSACGCWSLSTRFYVPQAFDVGYRLVSDAATLWNAFEAAHHKASLPGRLEIPMESFARAVEVVLKDSELMDAPGYCPDQSLWAHAVRRSGYVQSRHATAGWLCITAHAGTRLRGVGVHQT
ncbi:hypothetical protein CA603_05150 [Paraburkholderia hospita]|nr:hypothetical protein CA603_05150 [Paraburkholderia hospita]